MLVDDRDTALGEFALVEFSHRHVVVLDKKFQRHLADGAFRTQSITLNPPPLMPPSQRVGSTTITFAPHPRHRARRDPARGRSIDTDIGLRRLGSEQSVVQPARGESSSGGVKEVAAVVFTVGGISEVEKMGFMDVLAGWCITVLSCRS